VKVNENAVARSESLVSAGRESGEATGAQVA
jgi:hypothetical protein